MPTPTSPGANAGGAPKSAQSTNSAAKSALQQGSVYIGRIATVDPVGRTYDVALLQGTMLPGCIWAAGGIVAPWLGYNVTHIPVIGSTVAVLYNSPAYIISMLPSKEPDYQAGFGDTATGTASDIIKNLKSSIPGANIGSAGGPADMLEGELDVTNALRVGVTFLMTLIQLKAGDRAKVECHLLEDMVRIVCENFKQHTSFGDLHVYNDGRLNVEFNGTSYNFEAAGRLAAEDPLFELKNQLEVDPSKVDQLVETGRWRFTQYLGFLGNFIHSFVSDPTTTLGRLANDAIRSGKAAWHVNNDGSIVVQTVSEIVIERVCRVTVPIRVKHPQDPQGTTAAMMQGGLNADFLKNWDFNNNGNGPHETAFMLRQYARWLSGMHSYARFLQLQASGGDFKLPTEAETPAPSWSNKEKDVEAVYKGDAYYDTYSCMRLMRDGSNIWLDGYGNTILTGKTGVKVSSVTHLDLEAAGDIRVVAGQNIYMKARRHIEISASVGGIWLKARTALQALCEWGSIWLKSDAVDPDKEDAPTADDAANDPSPVVLPEAIMLEATRGKALVSSARTLTVQTTGDPDDAENLEDTSASVVVQAVKGGVRVQSRLALLLQSLTDNVAIRTFKDCVIKASRLLSQANTLVAGKYFTVKNGRVNCMDLRAKVISGTAGVQGPTIPGPSPGGGTHVNHISKLGTEREPQYEVVESDAFVQKLSALGRKLTAVNGPVWDFMDVLEYGGTQEHPFYETLAQQRIRTDTELAEFYSEWVPASVDTLKAGPRTGAKLPFPGRSARHRRHIGGEDLHKPSATDYTHFTQTPLSATVVTSKFLKK